MLTQLGSGEIVDEIISATKHGQYGIGIIGPTMGSQCDQFFSIPIAWNTKINHRYCVGEQPFACLKLVFDFSPEGVLQANLPRLCIGIGQKQNPIRPLWFLKRMFDISKSGRVNLNVGISFLTKPPFHPRF